MSAKITACYTENTQHVSPPKKHAKDKPSQSFTLASFKAALMKILIDLNNSTNECIKQISKLLEQDANDATKAAQKMQSILDHVAAHIDKGDPKMLNYYRALEQNLSYYVSNGPFNQEKSILGQANQMDQQEKQTEFDAMDKGPESILKMSEQLLASVMY